MDEGDWERMYGKTPTVYGESKMIEVKKSYVLELSEDQAKELYELLKTGKNAGWITHDRELMLVHHELKKLFDTGIR